MLIRDGQYQGVINRRVNTATLEAFIAACQLQKFRLTPANAFELQELAVEWGVSSLEKFTANFIKERNLTPPAAVDYLGILIEHLEEGKNDTNDILAVANYVNDVLADERLFKLTPEMIFSIICAANPQAIDQQLLIKFVMKLFERAPSSAVPLVLLIDFDRLTPQQRDFIFQCREMHEENIGYFVARALSSARNKAERELAQNESKLLSDLDKLRDDLKKYQRQALAKLRADQDQSIGKLREALKQQQAQITEMKEAARAQKEEIERAAENHEREFADMDDMLKAMDKITSQKSVQTEGQEKMIKAEVSDQIARLKRELEIHMEEVEEEDAKRCSDLHDELKEPIDAQEKRLHEFMTRADGIVKSLNATNDELRDLKATLAAKIVKDRLRFDKFIRQTDNRFKVFEQSPGVWDLKPERVRESEKFIENIEARVDQLCPIRKAQNT